MRYELRYKLYTASTVDAEYAEGSVLIEPTTDSTSLPKWIGTDAVPDQILERLDQMMGRPLTIERVDFYAPYVVGWEVDVRPEWGTYGARGKGPAW